MSEPLTILLNGKSRSFPELTSPAAMHSLIEVLGLKQDRIAVEHNGEIVSRKVWDETRVAEGDRLEIVHFVGGGACTPHPLFSRKYRILLGLGVDR
jgi:sulfur carrier protein